MRDKKSSSAPVLPVPYPTLYGKTHCRFLMPVLSRLFRFALQCAFSCAALLALPAPATAQQPSAAAQISPCKGSPLDSRTRVGVARCELSAPLASRPVGDRLRDMLVGAMIETSCFRVFDQSAQFDPLASERDRRAALEALGPCLWVTCQITEYTEQESRDAGYAVLTDASGGGTMGMTEARIGLLVRVFHLNDGRVLRSRFFEHEAWLLGATGGGAGFRSRAMLGAAREAVLDISTWLAEEREALLTEAAAQPNREPLAETAIQLSNTDALSVARVEQALRAVPGVLSVQHTLSGGSARLDVRHSCPVEEVLSALSGAGVGAVRVLIEGKMGH